MLAPIFGYIGYITGGC